MGRVPVKIRSAGDQQVEAARRIEIPGDVDRMVSLIARELAGILGERRRGGRPASAWRWAVALEHRSGTFEQAAAGWNSWLSEWNRRRRKTAASADPEDAPIARFTERGKELSLEDEAPTLRELEQLARWALLAPGNVILRAANRVFFIEYEQIEANRGLPGILAWLDLWQELLGRTSRERSSRQGIKQPLQLIRCQRQALRGQAAPARVAPGIGHRPR